MTPAQFLALARLPDAPTPPPPPRPRDYRAGEAGAGKEDYFLTLHCAGGLFYSMPFSQLQLIAGNRAGTVLELTFRMTIVLQGQQLQALTDGVRLRRITRLQVFDGAAHDPPLPGEPLITAFQFKSPTTSRA